MISNSELTDKGIYPTCYDKEHNHFVFGDNTSQMLYQNERYDENTR